MAPPRVSVAMTTFNGARYVEEQLESFAEQTRPPDQVVVCDDQSSDDTLERVRAFSQRAPFEVHAERNASRLATTNNFGKAVGLCDGDVVFFADQDDVWLPDKVQSVLEVFEQRPEVGAVFSNGRVVDEARRPLGYELWDSLWFTPPERDKVREGSAVDVFVKHVVAAGTTLAWRGRYRDLILPFPTLHDCHDAWVSFLVTAVSRVHIIERPLIDYRLHDENQFGLQRFNLREQLAKAREQLEKDIFGHNVTFFSAVEERLLARRESGFETSDEVRALIAAKIEHAKRRRAMDGRFWRRIPDVLREVSSRGYWRFSYGTKSVAQDLLLR